VVKREKSAECTAAIVASLTSKGTDWEQPQDGIIIRNAINFNDSILLDRTGLLLQLVRPGGESSKSVCWAKVLTSGPLYKSQGCQLDLSYRALLRC